MWLPTFKNTNHHPSCPVIWKSFLPSHRVHSIFWKPEIDLEVKIQSHSRFIYFIIKFYHFILFICFYISLLLLLLLLIVFTILYFFKHIYFYYFFHFHLDTLVSTDATVPFEIYLLKSATNMRYWRTWTLQSYCNHCSGKCGEWGECFTCLSALAFSICGEVKCTHLEPL